ncbi:WD40 repeat-like protein [Punctularia strigosozonata HHB-11173 SS5]|uniref:WD40 repeat-like protein n=1 Tax=Punctularia strigosozonata (strain HHB-11173) TaxID=741275 RepID=UPI000441723F|nr:WD40 repeat-like protein [Punctularia strigosozonata HHB-11173 SS5]EIN08347.1 WD40 repeat-like protein [Punctularia strigosozonata HHB-11173 SS5]
MSYKRTALFPCNPSTSRGVSTKLGESKDKIVYANGRTVIIRDLNNPGLSVAYNGHTQNTTVARISPSGFYCASADVGGIVRIWDIVGEDQTLKGEFKVISGRINDLAWDAESKRIIAVGDGKEKFGHAFMMDSGSSTGEIIGHSKAVNAVSIRHQRPFRAATAADDNLIVFHQGAPYKYDKTIKTHTNFVQDVRYAPSGDHFASVGSDAKIFLYDGKTGDISAELPKGHKGSIMACSWSPNSALLCTSSADCTVKLWDIEARKATRTWTLGSGISYQQVGNAWTTANTIVSLSISGDLNILDPRTADKPAKILQAPQRSITAAIPTDSSTFLAGTADGRVVAISADSGEAAYVAGDGHTNLVAGLASANGKVTSVGYDDQIRGIDSTAFTGASVSLRSQPKAVAIAGDGTVFVAGASGIEAIRDNQTLASVSSSLVGTSIAASGSLVAVGGEDQKVHLHSWDGKALQEAATLEGNKGVVSAVSFSPDGSLLAAGDSTGKIVLFDVKERKAITSRWTFHSARITSLDWTSDGKHCASGSLDTHVYIWSVQKPVKNIAIKNAGPGGVNSVFWLDGGKDGRLASAGADACVRVWNVVFHT